MKKRASNDQKNDEKTANDSPTTPTSNIEYFEMIALRAQGNLVVWAPNKLIRHCRPVNIESHIDTACLKNTDNDSFIVY